MPYGGYFSALMTGLAQSEARFYDDALSTFDSILPDNNNFTEQDATRMERELGLVSSSEVSLTDRKLAIIRKINHPGTIAARQHYLYVQGQLRAVGFDVYVHENLSRTNPFELVALNVQHGDHQHGDVQHGGAILEKVANKIDAASDADFNAGTSFSNLFYIGGEVLGTNADVDAEREAEFRELILRLKPQNQIAILLINYV